MKGDKNQSQKFGKRCSNNHTLMTNREKQDKTNIAKSLFCNITATVCMHINRNYVPAKPEELHSYERHDEQQQKNVNRLQRTYVSFDKRTDAIRKANKQSKPIELINQQCVMRVIIIK